MLGINIAESVVCISHNRRTWRIGLFSVLFGTLEMVQMCKQWIVHDVLAVALDWK